VFLLPVVAVLLPRGRFCGNTKNVDFTGFFGCLLPRGVFAATPENVDFIGFFGVLLPQRAFFLYKRFFMYF